MPDAAETFRAEWAFTVVSSLQVLACDLYRTEREQFAYAVKAFAARMTATESRAESLWLRSELDRISARAVRELRLTCGTCIRSCASRAPSAESVTVDWFDFRKSPRFLMQLWLVRFLHHFDRQYPCALPARAADLLRRPRPICGGIAGIARTLGVSVQVLRREFNRRYDLSPSAFHRRIQLRAGIRALRDAGLKVEAAAHRAGFESPASFYVALRSMTGLTLTELRSLPTPELVRLWEGPLQTEPAELYRRNLSVSNPHGTVCGTAPQAPRART